MRTLAQLFLSSDYHCRTLLEDPAHRYYSAAVGDELRVAARRFAAAARLRQALADDRASRRARDETEQLRQRLGRDAERAEQRDRELARPPSETAEVCSLRARDAELESAPAGVGRPEQPAGQRASAALIRQQRRAAQRAARKTAVC